MIAKRTKKEPTFADLKFEAHPHLPNLYTYSVAKFKNGEVLSICKRLKNDREFDPYGYANPHHPQSERFLNRSVRYEVMRGSPSGVRYDNEYISTDLKLEKLMQQVANIGTKAKRAVGKRKKAASRAIGV